MFSQMLRVVQPEDFVIVQPEDFVIVTIYVKKNLKISDEFLELYNFQEVGVFWTGLS